jgi:hypothetical protein
MFPFVGMIPPDAILPSGAMLPFDGILPSDGMLHYFGRAPREWSSAGLVAPGPDRV